MRGVLSGVEGGLSAMNADYESSTRDEYKKRFCQKITIDEKTGCHEWQGAKTKRRYGRFWFQGRMAMAHRVAWELTIGPIPAGLFVCHHCDNPSCCNPTHLFLGTPKDNTEDAVKKGRISRGKAHSTILKKVAARGNRAGARTRPDKLPWGGVTECVFIPKEILRVSILKEFQRARKMGNRNSPMMRSHRSSVESKKEFRILTSRRSLAVAKVQ